MSTIEESVLPPRRPVVVGVDGSEANEGALRWGANEARLRSAPMRLVTVVDQQLLTDAAPYFSASTIEQECRLTLAKAQRIVRQLTSGRTDVETQAVTGSPGKTLAKAGRDAELLVLGRHGRGGFPRLFIGSVAAAAVSRATVPTAVIPGSWEPASHPTEPVVVGVDGSPRSEGAIAFAFDEANRRGVSIRAVHVSPAVETVAWASRTSAINPPWRVRANRLISHSLEVWRDKFPAVDVVRVPWRGHRVGALVEEASAAQLIVVGGRPWRGLPGTMLGAVASGVVTHAGCPVVVVHEHAHENVSAD
jgi:nucleotide-binding universal stress UspA family protein